MHHGDDHLQLYVVCLSLSPSICDMYDTIHFLQNWDCRDVLMYGRTHAKMRMVADFRAALEFEAIF